jgi:hypothetical protein
VSTSDKDKEFEELLDRSSLGSPEVKEVIERSRQEDSGIGPFRWELKELLAVDEPDPRQLRRIAEVTEVVDGTDAAREWWVRAAAAGDRDASDYLLELIEEEEGQ